MLEIDNCTGCTACKSICPSKCIEMKVDINGFLQPIINNDMCKKCGRCESVCPLLNNIFLGDSNNLPEAYAAICNEDEIRENSSSGGIFTLFGRSVLENGGVVFGAAYDVNFEVHHVKITELTDLHMLRGSKYCQSKLGDCFSEIKKYLLENISVLFSGTPCQVEGLLHFLGKKYDNLFTIDIVCHGVPSPLAWKRYVSFMEDMYKSKIQRVNFRDKTLGWNDFAMSINFSNGQKYCVSHRDDVFMNAFLSNLCLRDSCYNCSFKSIQRNSDITLADFWGIDKVVPDMNDDKGTSLVFIQSQKGNLLFNMLSDQIVKVRVDTKIVAELNGAMTHSAWKDSFTEYFFYYVKKVRFDKLVRQCISPSYLARAKRKLFVNKS